ncbi:hypothetical protein GT755_12325 [Herbidospora sp. NEAU-GS84]|uniref:MmcB family DNA repair protein n=1 Tax=Herbidospora solisilvae TaxID=2696284 RepID=A0A7C9J8F3_9ACTN|nr:hypothetical protein [Herbidospora solisilvae]NAS22468.1 hypothetical protein [Herbidospora solisilvae]
MNTGQLLDLLVAHYGQPDGRPQAGEVLLTEVQAPGSTRRADLVRVGLWPSRGYAIDVHELKTSKADWRRELDDPAKADAWWRYSSRFWIVAPPLVVDPAEVPDGWGLMEAPRSGRRFKVVIKPEARKPELSLELVIRLVARNNAIRDADMQRLRDEQRNEIYRQVEAAKAKWSRASIDYPTQRRLDLLARVEEALGVTLTEWSSDRSLDRLTAKELGEALRDYTRDHAVLSRARKEAAEATGRLRLAADYIRNLLGPAA